MGRCFVEEVNPSGQPMEWPMPLWLMSDDGLDDLLDLKSLPRGNGRFPTELRPHLKENVLNE